MEIVLASGSAVAPGVPTLGTQGQLLRRAGPGDDGFPDTVEWASFNLRAGVTPATAGTLGFRLWGWFAVVWLPITLNLDRSLITLDSSRGRVNDANAVGEINNADEYLRYHEMVRLPKDATRVFGELTAPVNIVAASFFASLTARG